MTDFQKRVEAEIKNRYTLNDLFCEEAAFKEGANWEHSRLLQSIETKIEEAAEDMPDYEIIFSVKELRAILKTLE